jgi:hypothetical protein
LRCLGQQQATQRSYWNEALLSSGNYVLAIIDDTTYLIFTIHSS